MLRVRAAKGRQLAGLVAVLSVAAASFAASSWVSAEDTANKCAGKKYTIGFSHPFGESHFASTLKKKVKRFGDESGCITVLLDNTTSANLESQRATLESWVTQKVDAIVVLPVDLNALGGLQKKAQAGGIKWLTYAQPTKTADGSVGFDNVQSGDLVAKDALAWVKKHYPNGDVTAAVTTLTPLAGFAGRWDQPLQQFEKAGLKVVSKQDCATQSCGLQIAEDALRQHPNMKVFIGINDDAAIGALRAYMNAKVDLSGVYIAGQDGTLEGLEAVKKGGSYRASAAILLDELAKSILDNSLAAITGKGQADYVTPVVLGSLEDPKLLDRLITEYKD
jgi:ABC-type sugar transport system substrate-binding protein